MKNKYISAELKIKLMPLDNMKLCFFSHAHHVSNRHGSVRGRI